MPPWLWTIVATLSALGLSFLVFIALCLHDGFATWRRWRRFSRAMSDLDARVLAAREQAEHAQQEMRNNISKLGQFPLPPCDHDECPRRSGG